ncbi:hypothetical protein EV122DRAFT_255613 [Schizophyllum commune]|nr:hypothetical protein K525DRAFT_245667 [Schizophyllum commune Loenen D]
MSIVSTMVTAYSAPAFGQTLPLTRPTLSKKTRPLTHRDNIDLAAVAPLDVLSARPRFAELAKSMRSPAGRIRPGVAVGKWDEETLSRADELGTEAQAQTTGEDLNRPLQSPERNMRAESPTRGVTTGNMDMDVDDRSRASGSRHASSSGSDSEEEPLSSQRRTKASKTRTRSPEDDADNESAPLSKRPRVTLIVKSPIRRSPSPSSSEDRILTPPPRRITSSPSTSEDGLDYDAAGDPVHEIVCDVAGCGRTYKYEGAFWKHVARHEQETLLRDEAWGKMSTAKRGRGGSAKRGNGMTRRGSGTGAPGRRYLPQRPRLDEEYHLLLDEMRDV